MHDLAVIQYTSGTTGDPKGAMLSHYNLFSNARQGEAWMHGAQYRKEVFYAILPMFHAFGMTLFLTYGILKQARLVLFPAFDVDLVLAAAKKSPPTVYCAVPPIYERTANERQGARHQPAFGQVLHLRRDEPARRGGRPCGRASPAGCWSRATA